MAEATGTCSILALTRGLLNNGFLGLDVKTEVESRGQKQRSKAEVESRGRKQRSKAEVKSRGQKKSMADVMVEVKGKGYLSRRPWYFLDNILPRFIHLRLTQQQLP